jgi:hypothetical protein
MPAAAIMSLIELAKLNGLHPLGYPRDVLERLPAHPATGLRVLARWRSSSSERVLRTGASS